MGAITLDVLYRVKKESAYQGSAWKGLGANCGGRTSFQCSFAVISVAQQGRRPEHRGKEETTSGHTGLERDLWKGSVCGQGLRNRASTRSRGKALGRRRVPGGHVRR